MNITAVHNRSEATLPQETLPHGLLAHRDVVVLCLLFVAGLLLKTLPIVQYARVGGDPLLHFRFAMALLDGKLNVPVQINNAGTTVELYYPPLFHLISLGFFLAFPTIDPYAVMKVLAATFGSLQVVPLYFIVKRVSRSSTAALLASFSILTVRSDYQMLSWGGYPNIAGLLIASVLVYFVMTDRLVLSAIFSAALALTHHLSFVLTLAVLVPYFAMLSWEKKTIPKALVGLIAGGAVAYAAFYWFAMIPIYEFYSKFAPVYDQSLYVTPYILEQVGPPLLFFGALGFVMSFAREGRGFAEGKEVLVMWATVPVLLAYAYLFGVQWHGVRWIHFIPQPLIIWTGIGLGYLRDKKIALLIFVLIFIIQLVATLLGYHYDILRNLS